MRLCVETKIVKNIRLDLWAAASVRLCVETQDPQLDQIYPYSAASVRLCVETIFERLQLLTQVRSRLRAAVC